jgi:hypothetical protein
MGESANPSSRPVATQPAFGGMGVEPFELHVLGWEPPHHRLAGIRRMFIFL